MQLFPHQLSRFVTHRVLLLLLLHVTGLQNAGAMDIPVANNADSGNGTLRQAIQFNESLGGGNTIVFSNIVTGTITLTNPLGELFITKDVTITGPGAKALAVSGNNAHRVFHLTNNAAVSISGLKITGGSPAVFGDSGIGILQDSGTLALSNCAIVGNTNYAGPAGGIFANGTVTASGCTISDNSSPGNDPSGGGVYVIGAFTAVNCTFFGNSGGFQGGAIYQAGGFLALTNCTLSGNSCNLRGGGIYTAGGAAIIRNTIIAGNTAPTGSDCFGAFTSEGFNLIGSNDGNTGWGALGDQIGTIGSPLNPLLGQLQDNNGPTMTMAPQSGSPAVDQGNSSGIQTDQRGRPRPHTNDYVGSIPLGGDRSDIGAFELNPLSLVVSNNNDIGGGSLRQAIQTADPADGDVISFASNVVGNIALTSGELVLGKSLSILGPTTTPITVSGNNASRVFRVTSGGIVTISSLTISNGNTASQGAGVYNDFGCVLTLNNCAVIANVSGDNGGGIANNGAFAAYNCTFAGNRASFTGGGIYTYAGRVALLNCTVVSNSTVNAHGGGVCNYSLVAGTSNYITGTLVAGNSAVGHTDVIGVFTSGGYNLIGQIDYSTPGSGASAGVPTSGLTNGINHDQVGSIGSPIDPKIGRLQNNGGPTPTVSLLPNSPAIDQGRSLGMTTDQRGAPRPFDFASSVNAGGGDGSDIGAFELGSPLLDIKKSGDNALISWPAYYGDFTLQSVTNLTSTNWITVAGTPVVVGSQFNVTNSSAGGNTFYRLKNN